MGRKNADHWRRVKISMVRREKGVGKGQDGKKKRDGKGKKTEGEEGREGPEEEAGRLDRERGQDVAYILNVRLPLPSEQRRINALPLAGL